MKAFIPLLLVAALSGCAVIDPGESKVPQLGAAQVGLQHSDAPWPTAQWWHRYNDSQLTQLIDQALLGSPSMDAAQARLAMANAAVGGARAVQLPQADANFKATRQRFSGNYIYPPPYGGSMMTDADLRLNLGFDLDLWGRNRSRYAAAVSSQRAAMADLQMARNTLVSAVIQSYYKLQGALAQQTVLGEIVKQQENMLDITRQRLKAGLDTQIEVKQADSAVSAARVQLSQAATNAKLLRNQLSALLGSGPQRGDHISQVALTSMPSMTPGNIPLELLARRPDIVAARDRAAAATSQVSAAKAEFYPNVNLAAFAGFMSLGLDNLLEGASKTYGIGPAVSLPIFNGGALNAQLDTRKAERDIAVADYNQTLLTAVREVADASAGIQALKQQAIDQAASLEAIKSAYEIAVDRYKSGLGNFIQVLLAQNEVQKQALLDTDLRARAFALDAQLATALGGGYGAATTTH
ncbi:efflux transporter outer membrane subunit [Allopusillimonas ginsengisoli]|uniref:efflux transporter outer membrane subunit n=1 Tax=Allopusillimonas ginsengisoli TaxID=453575 RepID=UPI00101FF908|nr:efflux transporter outer membrane subunit [Allopusillimonas ginsengisoli]TEA79457.1 efflux transporter outer membrane subunit [Allopusillimonas ginsengisoli]